MSITDSVIAVFPDHDSAETAIKNLTNAGFGMKQLSLVGKGYHTEEKVVGFYTVGDHVAFWGSRGAFWGGFWGLFFGGAMLTIPLVGQVIVLGTLAAMVVSALEGAVIVGGLSGLAAALYSLGVPKDSVIAYETAIRTDGFLVMAHGTTEDIERARAILHATGPSTLDVHAGPAGTGAARALATV
nr:hypothetical protein [uncultured Gellertiella sp.]